MDNKRVRMQSYLSLMLAFSALATMLGAGLDIDPLFWYGVGSWIGCLISSLYLIIQT